MPLTLEQTARHHGVPLSAEFVTTLRKARLTQGLTTHELAAMIGVCDTHLKRMERGGHTPRWKLVERWARVLGFGVRVELHPA